MEPADLTTETRKKFFPFGCVLIIILTTLIAYYPSLQNGFTNWDDNIYIYENPLVTAGLPDSLSDIFTNIPKGGQSWDYVPLTTLSFAIECHFFKFEPFFYHLNNLLLHISVSLLVFWFALQLGIERQGALFAALIFSVHPLHVEPVAWLSARKDVLYALFYMLSLNYYWRYLESHRPRPYVCSIIFGLLSMLSKSMALSLPLVFLICDWYKQRRFDKTLILDKIPFLLFITPLVMLRLFWLGNSSFDLTFESPLVLLWCFMFYIQKFIFPALLLPYYKYPTPIELWNIHYVWAAIMLLALIYLIFRLRKNRLFIFGMLFYLASIFYVLRVAFIDGSSVSDRYMYLASIGFCLTLGKLFYEASEKLPKRFCCLILIIIIASLSFKTYTQSKIWQNSFSLWTHTIQRSPLNAVAYHNRASAYTDLKNYKLAKKDFLMALEANASYSRPLYPLGIIEFMNGEYENSVKYLTRHLKLNPNHAPSYYYRSLAFKALKEPQKSLKDLHKANLLGLEPDQLVAVNYSAPDQNALLRSLGKLAN